MGGLSDGGGERWRPTSFEVLSKTVGERRQRADGAHGSPTRRYSSESRSKHYVEGKQSKASRQGSSQLRFDQYLARRHPWLVHGIPAAPRSMASPQTERIGSFLSLPTSGWGRLWLGVTLGETIVDGVLVGILLANLSGAQSVVDQVLARNETSVLPVYLGLFVVRFLA